MNQFNLEQEFKIAQYTKKIQSLNHENTKKYLKTTLNKMMIKDNIIKYFIKKSIS